MEEGICGAIKWSGKRPDTFSELFDFYHNYVKPLYAAVQAENELPQEVLFELNAALDHLARHWTYDETEDKVVARAYGHLKRACLDVFKIRLVKTVEQRNELSLTDLSIVDNGEFHKELNSLFADIQKKATLARKSEGRPDEDGKVPAFEIWEDVFVFCLKFEEEFYLNTKVNWARKTGIKAFCKNNLIGFILGIVASLVASAIFPSCAAFLGKLVSQIVPSL